MKAFEIVGYSGKLLESEMVRPLTSNSWVMHIQVRPPQMSLPDTHRRIGSILRLSPEGNIIVGPGNLFDVVEDVRRIEEDWGLRRSRYRVIA